MRIQTEKERMRKRTDKDRMRIWVFGGGSLGLLYAAKLSATDCEVVLVTRTHSQAQAIRSEGIGIKTEMTTKDDMRRVVACSAVSMQELRDAKRHSIAPPDWILLTVKQYDLTDQVVRLLASFAVRSEDTNLLALQNGIGHMEKLAAHMNKQQLYAAVVSEGALRTSSTEVVHTGFGLTKLGASLAENFVGADSDQKIKQLQNVLQYAGFQTVLSNQLNIDIWQKLIVNSVINPLTALLQIRNGALLEHTNLQEIMYRLCEEAHAVAKQVGINLDNSETWRLLREVCRNTAANKSSMLQDLEAGRPTEVQWINGAIVKAAGLQGVEVPTHDIMVRLVQAREEIR